MLKHIVVWIDHKEAHIFHINPDTVEQAKVTAPPQSIHHRHPKGPEGAKEHPNDAKHYFDDVVRGLEGTERILIVGPSTAKLELIRHVHKHAHALEQRIVGVETVDHPTDGQLVAFARKYFKRADALL